MQAGPSVRVDLPRGNVVEIRMLAKVTRAEFEQVKRIFDLAEVAFLEDERSVSAAETTAAQDGPPELTAEAQ